MEHKFDIEAAKSCLSETFGLINKGASESVLRERFASHLQKMFPEEPWWVTHHGLGAEHRVDFNAKGEKHRGFVDTLIGLTVVEYEKDISQSTLFNHGLDQVKDYCAGLLNNGHPANLIVGVLSDTARWRAYIISSVATIEFTPGVTFGRNDIILEEVETFEPTISDDKTAYLLGEFLSRYLGRHGARQLEANILASDIGFESRFCERHISEINNLVNSAFSSNQKYANLIERLWCDFVSYLGKGDANEKFDKTLYVRELYLLTLAKLLCANVIEKRALISNDPELKSILNGGYFKLKGLPNLVEYDYFGWLNEEPHIIAIIPVARAIQEDLHAYDFRSPPIKDLFGEMMAQLAKRSQRLLLGQEWTPSWLAAEVVRQVYEKLPQDEDPCFVDICCGSGTMIVEAIKLHKAQLDSKDVPKDSTYVSKMVHAITGFDIDPLAVMLAKVSWVIAARDRLEPFGFFKVSIPIYHADSLFVTTPLTKKVDEETGAKYYDLILDDKVVSLPRFLVSPEYRTLFDELLNSGYELAMSKARESTSSFESDDLSYLLALAMDNTDKKLVIEDEKDVLSFCMELVKALEALQRDGRNGIWAFVLRNSYRPGLVSGLFNGLVLNPPWLALSKIGDNPYAEGLKERAENYGINPPGSSHLHVELATTFLLHAINQYLKEDSSIGCILPETVLSGKHHNPFRRGDFLSARKPVFLKIEELWRVEKGTFKNEAIVLFGKKTKQNPFVPLPIPGSLVASSGHTPLSFNQIEQGKRIAWSDAVTSTPKVTGFFEPDEFRQGADIMPRTLIFHEVTKVNIDKWKLGPIDRQTSRLRYLVSDAKKFKEFKLPECIISDRFIFDVLLSNHLTPFNLFEPAKALLPIMKNSEGYWVPVSSTLLALHDTAKQAFNIIFSTIDKNITTDDFFEKLDSKRKKLTNQLIPSYGWLVFMGAGGDYVCAAYTDTITINPNKLIVDQTLYWTWVATEDEAIYYTGLLNSEAINMVIKEFQPRGAFGARHVHKLPLEVTPKFDPSDVSHVAVVEQTRQLISEWNMKINEDDGIRTDLDPNKSLATRRRVLRATIQTLPAYSNYALAAKNLYGV